MCASRPRRGARIAESLIRGPDAPYVLADLEEAFDRDIARGLTVWSARRRYAMNVVGSAVSTWRGARRFLPGGTWLDVKLGTRMLLKQPMLTLVATLTLALGIPIGLLPLHVLDSLTAPLPVEDADDIVRVWNWDREESHEVRRPLHDVVEWREELTSFEDLGVGWSAYYNVISEDGRAAPVRGAEVTASVFNLLRAPPEMGRALNEDDEVVGAPNVVVIGYDLWQARLAADPEIVGTTIRIGPESWTVVGVMPEGFLFPYRDHLWLPYRYDPLQYERGQGPVSWVMGRLAEGVTIEDARVELSLLGQRMALEFPDTHGHLQPQVLPYTEAQIPFLDRSEGLWQVLLAQLLSLALLALACCNVGVLILARVATRTGEIAIRTALGASRGRIVSQIFVESLALAVGSAGVGLLAGQLIALRLNSMWGQLPYWAGFEVTGKTIVLVMSLAVFSAAIVGVVPALKATGRNGQLSMKRAAGGGSGIRFGTGSSVLIVAQVSVAVWCVGFGSALAPALFNRSGGLGIQADQYVSAALWIPRVQPASSDTAGYTAVFEDRDRDAHVELRRRLAAEPGVGPVAMGTALPGMSHSRRRIEVEGEPLAPGSRGHPVRMAGVDVGFFKALDQGIRSGRDFSTSDVSSEGSPVIVNTTFVERVLGGRQPLGQRIRYAMPGGAGPGPWHEIVGVVGHLGMNQLNPDVDEGVYHPVAPGALRPLRFAMRTGPDPGAFIPRLRSLVAEIDASAILQDAAPLDETLNYNQGLAKWGFVFVAVASGITILLSGAGLHALVSFTVAERTGEIGIRTALGAAPVRIIATISRRAFGQLLVGVLVGAALASLMLRGVQPGADVLQVTNWRVTVPLIALGVIAVGMLACIAPTRRALQIRPAEALKG